MTKSSNKLDYKVAVLLLKSGQPLPVDLLSRLEAQGIDITKLEARYGQ